MTKRYTIKSRKTGKIQSRKFYTREDARAFKRDNGFRYDIVDLMTGNVVR